LSADDDQYSGVLKVLSELHASWLAYQQQLTGEILDYKKTVNTALASLGQEAIKHQRDTAKRIEDDTIERRSRQAQVDAATAQVREEMLTSRAETLARLDTSAATVREEMLTSRAETLQRLDATNAHSAQHERRAGRERIGLLTGMGCMALLLLLLIALAIVLIAQNYWVPK